MNAASSVMVKRQKLIHAFSELNEQHIIAVCAPAGYGKTVAVAHWLEKNTHAHAVFSIDEYDNNIIGFCERFCSALYACQPSNKLLNELILHFTLHSSPEEFVLRAIAALSTKKQAVIVIDDLHLIHNSIVLRTLLVFINRLPSNFQIVLVSRHELPLMFSDLWLKGKISRISANQFLFTNEDIKALYKKRGKNITTEDAENIVQRTQGWAIGINALLLFNDQSSEKVYEYLDNFIQANIWQRWDAETREFMVCTAGLRVLIPDLCDKLTSRSDSEVLLEELVSKGAFVTKLQSGVYRYHQLFKSFLEQIAKERGEKFEHALLEKEGHWHLSQNDFQSAINCFVKNKNHDAIVKSLESVDYSYRPSLLADKIVSIIKHPEVEAALRKHPHLMILLIWGSFIDGNKEAMLSFMDEYYSKFTSIITRNPTLAHEIFYVKALDFRIPSSLIMMSDQDLLANILSTALGKILSMAMPSSTVRKWILPMDTPMIHRGLRDFSDVISEDSSAIVNSFVTKFGWLLGEELDMIRELGVAEMFYARGYLEEANVHALKAVAEVKSHFSTEINFCVLAMFVRVLDALDKGDSEEAKAMIKHISKIIDDNQAYHLSLNFKAFVARREIAHGNISAAEDWLYNESFIIATPYKAYAGITTCRALIATAKYDSACIALEQILKMATEFNRTLDIIEAQILLAIACWKKKKSFQTEALDHLESAVWRAHSCGHVQIFVNEKKELAGILSKLINRVKQQKKSEERPLSFIKMLYLKCYQENTETPHTKKSNAVKYTEKQMAIMLLICEGKTYNEMAEALNIKRSTLRTHLELIYRKLDVTSIADAALRIKSLDIL